MRLLLSRRENDADFRSLGAGLPRYAVAPEGETCSTMKLKIKES